MKERVDATKMLREPSVNGPSQDSAVPGGVSKLDSADVKAEVKEEEGRKSTDSRPPSRKIPNGDSDNTLAIKSEDNNNKRAKVERKLDNSKSKLVKSSKQRSKCMSSKKHGKTENGKPGSVGTDSQKASPQSSTPQHPSSGGNTPATMMSSQHGMVTSLEPPFMQQQSEIFVFSTSLANQAAESVRLGQYKSIIQYHMEHPNTKAFLQKNPLKANNFRQGMPAGMMGGMKGQPAPGMMRMHGPGTGGWGPGMEDPNMMGPGGPMMPNGPYPPGGPPGPRMMGGWPGQGCGGPHPHPHPHGPMGPGGYPPGNMMDMESEMMMGGPHLPSNISSSQVPDENLTMEQRQHRSKGLAQLTKIHQMLMGGNNQPDGRPPTMGPENHPGGPGMYPGGPGMMSQQQAMMSQGGMMPPHSMMSPQHQHMMAQQGMPPYGPRGPPGMVPPGMNGKDQYQAQHEWYQVQREFYMEKQHRIQHMAAGRGGPHMEPGPPPPSYYSSISQKHGGMGGPTSPNMNGMRMPMPPHGPHGPMGPGMDPDAMGMYGGPHDMCRPPHMGMEPMPGMHGYPPHGMPPQGHPMDPGFDPTMGGGMPPGMGPGPPGGPRHHGPMRQGHMMGGPNGMMPGMKGPNQVTLHRAGNPEQFNPETMGGVVPPVVTSAGSNSSKPPPSYAQAQKRKRGDDMDDAYTKGNLQQTPSPTKIHYHLSQFEGQELTITKQLNSAFVAGNGGDESNGAAVSGGGGVGGTAASGTHFNNHTNSPLHGPGSNKGPQSNSSQTSTHMASSPAVSNAGPSPHTGPTTPHSAPHPSSVPPTSGANMRLSHFDPSAPLSNGVSSAPHTPNPKSSSSSMSNITSASLANLAKGVENLSNQMQQNMMQGGPFHSIQMQGQMTSSSSSSNSGTNNSNNTNSSTAVAAATSSSSSSSSASSLSTHSGSAISSQTPTTPSVNNTYIATNMSISQVNVPNHPSMNSYVNMQMQSMSSESTHMSMPSCSMQHAMGPQMGPGMMGGGPRPGMSHHMTQSQGMMSSMGPMPPGGPSPGMGPQQGPMGPGPMNPGGMAPMPPHRPNSSCSMPATPPAMNKMGQFTSPPLSHPQLTGSGSQPMPGGVGSPSYPITSSSNSSVQIQQKGHNTIQYLPANPPSTQPSGPKQRSDMDYNMPRFPSPLHGMDGKNPSSTLQYFPTSSPPGSRPPMSSALSAAAAMGPELANQATIAMHQSASMMRSSSIPDLQAMQAAVGPNMPPSSMGPMDNPGHMGGPGIMSGGPGPMMGGPDPMMGMGGGGHMRPGHSPGSMRSMPPGMGAGSLECVSPIPGMGGYMNSGPSIEQAQAQAQAHAAMMMQGNTQIPVSSPHGPMPSGGPSPHMPHGHMPGTSMHGPMPPGSMPGSSPHVPSMPGQSPHGPPMSVQSPHVPMPGPMPGPSPHGPMPGPMQGPPPHGPMPGHPPHSSMAGPMPPHGHMGGHMHGPGMPPGAMAPRHPGMGGMRMPGPGMGVMPPGPGQYGGMQYPGYPQQDYYNPGPPRGHPRQMMPGMMGGPGQPYGMMSNMPGPS